MGGSKQGQGLQKREINKKGEFHTSTLFSICVSHQHALEINFTSLHFFIFLNTPLRLMNFTSTHLWKCDFRPLRPGLDASRHKTLRPSANSFLPSPFLSPPAPAPKPFSSGPLQPSASQLQFLSPLQPPQPPQLLSSQLRKLEASLRGDGHLASESSPPGDSGSGPRTRTQGLAVW